VYVRSITKAPRPGARNSALRTTRIGRTAAALVLIASFIAAPSSAFAAWSPSSYQNLVEQVASQKTITALIEGRIASLYIGRCRIWRGTATAPVTARFRDGTSMAGTIVLKQYRKRWYFYSINAGSSARGISDVSIPAGINTGVMRTAVAQQTTNQSFALGIIYGRFRTITVNRVTRNWGTATVRLTLSGGRSRARGAQISCLRKDAANGKPYWFLAAIR
jgi:hypothetical protein